MMLLLASFFVVAVAHASSYTKTASAASNAAPNCKQYTIREDDTCLRIGRATNATYAQLLSWNPTLDVTCSNLADQVGGTLCISNPLGDYGIPNNSHGAPPMATTAAPVPSPTADKTTPYCGEYHYVETGEDCSTISITFGITLKDFLFLNPMVWENCTNLQADVYYCVEPVGQVSTYPGYGGATTRDPIKPIAATTLPVTEPILGNLTSDDPIIPIAKGTRKDCYSYTYLGNITDNEAANCWSLAMVVGASPEDFILWNPSLAQHKQEDKMDSLEASTTAAPINEYAYPCTLSANTSYCILLSSPTPAPEVPEIRPPTPRAAGEVKNCTAWAKVHSYDTCEGIMIVYHLDIDTFYIMNPSVGRDCKSLAADTYYCVSMWPGGGPDPALLEDEENDDSTDDPVTLPTPTARHTTSPSPVQTGMVGNCNKFYKVAKGDGCYDIAHDEGIDLVDFYSWNSAVKDDCSGLQADVYVCVGAEKSAEVPPTSTSSDSGPSTPTPTQDGMIKSCTKFYKVKSGDVCWAIANDANISPDDFAKWNPAVKDDCSGLMPDYYVCVGVSGDITGPTTTTSTRPGGSTPTPTQSSMVSDCDSFYKVKLGDGCWAIANDAGISTEDFSKWNPAVQDDCSGLQAGYYVCIGTKSSGASSPTTTNGGVTTPTPTQDGMIANCKKFYLVKSGNGCYDIAHDEGIDLDDFYKWNEAVKTDCSGLQANVYVCIGL